MKEKEEIMGEKIMFIILSLLITGVLASFITPFAIPVLCLGLLGLVLCLKKIPADPPHLGLVTFRGERTENVKKEGWRFLAPFFPFLYDVILINVERKNQDLPAETVRTPDLAQLEIPISMTWTPGSPNPETNGKFLINYLNNGGEKGVKAILADIVQERVREWAFAENEGPKTFQEAIGAKGDAVAILIKAIAGEDLERIPSLIPTTVLLDYFQGKPPNAIEKNFWGENWEKVKEIFEEEDEITVKEAIEERRKIIQKIKVGNGTQPVEQLGITFNRLNIKDIIIKPGTQLEIAAEKKVTEERERDAEKTELDHIRKRIEELMGKPYDFTPQEARDIIQTERGKVKKNINDIQGLEAIGEGIGKILTRR